jgi:hypothetical protein
VAKVVEDFDWGIPGRPAKYPWDEWLDGRIWVLRRGEDFACDVETIRSGAKKRLRKKGMTIRTRIHEEGDVLVMQVVPKGADFYGV